MGKIRHERQRLHTKAVDIATTSQLNIASVMPKNENVELGKLFMSTERTVDDGFGPTKPKPKILDPSRLSKNDKKKLRHVLWMQKLEVSKIKKDNAAHSQLVAANPLNLKGGFDSLMSALPDLDLLKANLQPQIKDTKETAKAKAQFKQKSRKVVSRTSRQLTLAREAAQLTNIIGLGVYRANPADVIKQHLENKSNADML